ncbi:2-hydroxymuconate semialdehyde hydrolase [compost metagenome]
MFNSGFQSQTDTFCQLSAEQKVGVFGIYFQPYAIPFLFGLPTSEITNQNIEIAELLGKDGVFLEEKVLNCVNTQERVADDAIHILDGYHIRQANIMGISLGGLIGQIVAIKYPERVGSLVLMSTGPWGTPDPNVPEMDKQIIDFQVKAMHVNWDDENATVKYMLESSHLMAGQKPVNYAKEEERVRANFHRSINYRSMFNHALLQGGEAYYDRLNEIKSPTLIIHGSEDKIWHFGHTDKLLSEIKNSELLKLNGTGHELNENDWDIIINRLNEFMK